jgi:hypothetical protein
MSGRIIGVRYKVRKLPQWTTAGGRKIYWVEMIIEHLHCTKGWRGKHRTLKAMDHMMWIQHPPTVEYFMPSDGWPAGETRTYILGPPSGSRLQQRRIIPKVAVSRPSRRLVHAWQRKEEAARVQSERQDWREAELADL